MIVRRELCITADDYGLSAEGNTAIESLAQSRRLTAVSIMAHRYAHLSSLQRLVDTHVTLGIHVCLTREEPLTSALGSRLFPNYRELFARLLLRPSLPRALLAEAQAQIERLQTLGVPIAFLNAHEHVHLFPPLWPMFAELSRRLGVRAVRVALGQPIGVSGAGALALASRLSWKTSPLTEVTVLSPLGVGHAGALTSNVIDSLLGRTFVGPQNIIPELCVHPGLEDPGRRAEYELLASGELTRIVQQRGLAVLDALPLPH